MTLMLAGLLLYYVGCDCRAVSMVSPVSYEELFLSQYELESGVVIIGSISYVNALALSV